MTNDGFELRGANNVSVHPRPASLRRTANPPAKRAGQPNQATMAAQLERPLARLLHSIAEPSDELRELIASLDAVSGRVAVAAGFERFRSAARLTGYADIGLRAALFSDPSDFDALEWVVTSAANWNDACETVCRYAGVLSDATEYRVELCGDKVHVILGSSVPMPSEASDFQLAAFHLGIQRWFPELWPELEVWMKHEQPADISAHRAIFPHFKLVFRAAFDGFVYDAARLQTPLPTANPVHHHELRTRLEEVLHTTKDEPQHGLVARTSLDILHTMRRGDVAAQRTAARLGMARRTLVRRLAEHGTSYSELLKEARYGVAMHYLHNTPLSVEDIAFLLGYSECAAFVRAFKRWSGRAPLAYRRTQT